jgi:hypothetical protein
VQVKIVALFLGRVDWFSFGDAIDFGCGITALTLRLA